MHDIVIKVNSDNEIVFRRSSIFDKMTVAQLMAQLRGKELWFTNNDVTVKVNSNTEPIYLFCAWLDTHRTRATEIGPETDPVILEELVRCLGKLPR